MARGQPQAMSAGRVWFAVAPVDRRGNRGIQCRNNTWRIRHSDDRHDRWAVVVAGRRRCGARSNRGCRVAARGAAAVGGATGGANCQHASRETPAAGIDGGRGTLRDGLVGRPPGGDPVGGGDELCRHRLSDRGSGRARARKIEPLAKFFHDAEMQVRTISTPPSLSTAHGQYVEAMALYANAAAEMLKFTEDGDLQHLGDAHRMDVRASEDMLRVGEVLWPGQYKPH